MSTILKISQRLSIQALLYVAPTLNEEQNHLWPGNQAHIDLILSLSIP